MEEERMERESEVSMIVERGVEMGRLSLMSTIKRNRCLYVLVTSASLGGKTYTSKRMQQVSGRIPS